MVKTKIEDAKDEGMTQEVAIGFLAGFITATAIFWAIIFGRL